MSQRLINLSPDLKRLRDEGYEIQIKSGHVLIKHIPYLNSNKELGYGVLICPLNFAGDVTVRPSDHTAYFQGDHPCNLQGNPIQGIVNSSGEFNLLEDFRAQHYMSNKPQKGHYDDYYEKFTNYIRIISSYAREMYPDATAQTFITYDSDEDSIYEYADTNVSRAKINAVSDKLKHQRVAIIGIGGTGSYILDMVAKTSVKEIHLYDGDEMLTHNAFRSPGAPSLDDLRKRSMKVDYFSSIYARMRKGIIAHAYKIEETNVHKLLQFDFVFVAIDSGISRKLILNFLMEHNRFFIDVGIDIRVVDDSLIGQARTTLGANHYDHIGRYVSYADSDNDEYRSNIQISELNAFNATMAVIKWKQISGYYKDIYKNINSIYTIQDGGLSHAYKED
jgi:hypothetical protein